MIPVAVVLALLVGVSLGLLGGGGSLLTVPLLRYVVGLEAHRAVALSLLIVGITSLAALVPHARRGRVRWRTGVVFGAAGMVGAFLAGRVAHWIPAAALLLLFAAILLATSVAMLSDRPRLQVAAVVRELPVVKVLGEGLVVGAVTGLVGAGGGFLVVPALVLLGGLPMNVAVGTSLLVIAMKSFAGFAGFLGHTPIDWTLAAWLGGAAVIGSVLGGLLADRVSSYHLRRGFGWLVVAMALFMLGQELPRAFGAAPPIALPLALSVLGTVAAVGVRQLWSRASAPAAE